MSPFASSHGHGSNLGALYSADWEPSRERSHADYWSANDASVTHRAGVSWDAPREVRTIRIRFRSGHEPAVFRVLVRRGDAEAALHEQIVRADGPRVEIAVGGPAITGVVVEQAPGGGGPAGPGVLCIGCIAVIPAVEPEIDLVLVDADGTLVVPGMPIWADGDPHTFLDASDMRAIEVRLRRPQPVGAVALDLVPIGYGSLHPRVVQKVAATTDRIRIDLPESPCILGITNVSLIDADETSNEPARAPRRAGPITDDAGAAFRARGDWTIAAARTHAHVHRRACALGVPGTDLRVGVAPDGTFTIPLRDTGSHADCTHVSFGPAKLVQRRFGIDSPVLELDFDDTRRAAFVDPASARLVIETPPGAPELRRFDYLWRRGDLPAPVEIRPPGSPRPPFPDILGDVVAYQLPAEWQTLVRALLTQASLFVRADGSIPYALWPSVYDGDVYGLEEEWLMHALAQWGMTDLALGAFRASYLRPAHLSKHHYLHDLRNGLTPWQAARLLRLAGRRPDEAFSAEQIALLRECADWATLRRRETASATGAPDARGIRTFPGLLPPFRFGGDLDFPTQSLHTDALNAVGLQALAEILSDGAPFASEAADWRRSLDSAWEAVRKPDFLPLHTGGGDPGSYYQLMAAGILDPVDYFPPGDPRADLVDSYMEKTGRLWFALPRFDDWGAAGFGIDAHYAVGYLLRALREGRREIFWTGLFGMVAHAMDPDVFTFREVDRVDLAPGEPWHDLHVPGRRLAQTEPCVGGVGVVLQLVRAALVLDLPGGGVRLLGGVPPTWLEEGSPIAIERAPTQAGTVSVHAMRSGNVVHVRFEAPGAAFVEVVPPSLVGWTPDDPSPIAAVPAEAKALEFRYHPSAR